MISPALECLHESRKQVVIEIVKHTNNELDYMTSLGVAMVSPRCTGGKQAI